MLIDPAKHGGTLPMYGAAVPPIDCRDGCGRSATEEQLLTEVWQYLDTTKRWRCPNCRRALEAIRNTKEAK